ncbi:pyrroline-5-carboxylate reductase [Bordetella pertussis]|nr:pyrroline-5-carboxylate reductase [Bordetella pertussis]
MWVYAVKPQHMREAVAGTRPWLRPDTLIVSVAAGIRADTLAGWLGEPGQPWQRLVRCMPNTPALVGAGMTGLAALPGVTPQDRELAGQLLTSVGEVVWVDGDAGLDAVTALSGSGPAYVFLFIEALIAGGRAVGLTDEQARQLALGTLAGATRLAAQSDEPPAVLRERVTSKGGTTAAALDVYAQGDFRRPGRARHAGRRAPVARAGRGVRPMSSASRRYEPLRSGPFLLAVFCMGLVVVGSNILVQVPLNDWLTWGGLSYPVAFLVTDVLNRRYGPDAARRVAWFGFAAALAVSVWVASPRIALASGLAYLCAQLIDIRVFDRLRDQRWWRAPLISGVIGAVADTAVFFSVAFAAPIRPGSPGCWATWRSSWPSISACWRCSGR